MDIYAYADSIQWEADYYDQRTGYIYGIQEAGRQRKYFGIDAPIPVYDSDHNLIGYAKKSSGEE